MTDQMLAGVGAAVEYIESHLESRPDLDQVAAAAHYSKYHLHRIFSEAVGIPVHEYVGDGGSQKLPESSPALARRSSISRLTAVTKASGRLPLLSGKCTSFLRQNTADGGIFILCRCLFCSAVRSQEMYAPRIRSVRQIRKTSRPGWIWSGRLSADIHILPSRDICRICRKASPNSALSCGKTLDRRQGS